MISAMGRRGTALVLGLSVALVVFGALASSGFYIVDEIIYYAGALALHDTGSFVIANGYEQFGSDDLRLWTYIAGPQGLVPQYPVGTALLGAPLIGLFGQKALIVLNVAAGIGTLFATHALARRLFASRTIADVAVLLLAFCTFWGEYVVGQWPHSVSILSVTLALWLFLDAIDRRQGAWLPALAAGLAIGAGMSFRLEGALALAPVAVLTILLAARPATVLAGGATGLAPMLALIAWSNQVKFGTWNPLSYGSSGGGTDVHSYIGLGIAMVALLIGLVVVRLLGNRGPTGVYWVAVLLVSGGIVAVFPGQSLLAARALVAGIHALLIDSTAISDPRSGMVRQPDGTLLFWGLAKKALGQSLPWLGGLALLVGLPWGERRRSVSVVLVFACSWMLPFLLRSWHGGLGLNMRYFLPVLPPFAALAAWLLVGLARRAGARLAIYSSFAGLVLPVVWLILAPGDTVWLEQRLSTWGLVAIAAVSLCAGFGRSAATARLAVVAIGIGLGFSSFLAMHDFSMSQARRSQEASLSKAAAGIPGPVVIYGAPEAHSAALYNSEQILALPDRLTDKVDMKLVKAACAAGYRVLMPPSYSQVDPALAGRLETPAPETGMGREDLKQVSCRHFPAD